MSKKKPVVLLILDGWGHRESNDHNAIALANTPVWDKLLKSAPYSLIDGSGKAVGLPNGQMGNSEVGHLCLGSGRVIYQDLERINDAIESGSFYKNETLVNALQQAKSSQKKVHVISLLSPGGVHSHQDHMLATLELAKSLKIESLYVHALLDGRDTPPKSAQSSIALIDDWFSQYGHGKIASIIGRYFAMDRDRRYERTEQAYQCIVEGHAPYHADNTQQGLLSAYQRDETDEFVKPTIIGEPVCIEDGDVVIFLNFRADRVRQIMHAIGDPNFSKFVRSKAPKLGKLITLTEYDDTNLAEVAFKPEDIPMGLGEVIESKGLTQLRLAETEKYAHVTFFFNGSREKPFEGEDRILIPSPKVNTYDLKPEMSAAELTNALVEAIEQQKYDLIICNYANADMVGHTGNLEAAIQACEVLDKCLGRIIPALQSVDGEMLITADHGNVEMMVDPETAQPHTAHTTQLVPLVYVGPKDVELNPGSLADIAPTILKLMNIAKPQQMTGSALIS